MAARRRNKGSYASQSTSVERRLCVFINCPFDREYQPIFDALVFATVACGFHPRSAIETGSTSSPRMERIVKAIFESKYSIHDLSRCRGEGDQNLARFNMPLELGIAMAQRFGDETRQSHDWLLLVPNQHPYKRFISDLGGFDPKGYDETKDSAVSAVVSWLSTRDDAVATPTSRDVLSVLGNFERQRQQLAYDWHDDIPWPKLLQLALQVAEVCELGQSLRPTQPSRGSSTRRGGSPRT